MWQRRFKIQPHRNLYLFAIENILRTNGWTNLIVQTGPRVEETPYTISASNGTEFLFLRNKEMQSLVGTDYKYDKVRGCYLFEDFQDLPQVVRNNMVFASNPYYEPNRGWKIIYPGDEQAQSMFANILHLLEFTLMKVERCRETHKTAKNVKFCPFCKNPFSDQKALLLCTEWDFGFISGDQGEAFWQCNHCFHFLSTFEMLHYEARIGQWSDARTPSFIETETVKANHDST